MCHYVLYNLLCTVLTIFHEETLGDTEVRPEYTFTQFSLLNGEVDEDQGVVHNIPINFRLSILSLNHLHTSSDLMVKFSLSL